MASRQIVSVVGNRRKMLKSGLVAAGAVAAVGMTRVVTAQESTPVAGNSLIGAYAVSRTYVTATEANLDELKDKVQNGYVPIIEKVDGFLLYTIMYNSETRVWTAIAYFNNPEGAAASTEAAADYVVSADLGSYFEDPSPLVSDGEVIIASAMLNS
jgi:hypothetical protein